MGQIVLGVGTSHSPGQTGLIDKAPIRQVENVYEALGKIRRTIESLQPDLILELSNGHYSNFNVHNMPAVCVGIGPTHYGPIDGKTIRIPEGEIPGHPEFAKSLVEQAYESGFDLAWSGDLRLDSGIMVPYHTFNPDHTIPLVPILLNAMVLPVPTASRMYQFGSFLRKFIVSRPKNERIVIMGTGGISHDVASQRSGWIDSDFDHEFLENLGHGRVESVTNYTTEKFERSGNGAKEVLAWMAAMGAMGDRKAKVLTYEPVVEWITGTGVVVWEP